MLDMTDFQTIDTEAFRSPSLPATSGTRQPAALVTDPSSDHINAHFERVVGQRRAVAFLSRLAEGAALGGEPDPILLLGPSGRGKTLLASRFAAALAMPFISITCGREVTAAALVEKIAEHTEPVVCLMDEVHSLPKKTSEALFYAIDEAKLPAIKNGRIDRTAAPVAIARHIWVAATNIPGGILRALRSRLITICLEDYQSRDLEEIASRKAESLGLMMAPDGIALVAEACNGSPRKLGHLLKTVAVMTLGWRCERDLADKDTTLPTPMVADVIRLMGIDAHGLDATSRSLLTTIAEQPSGSASAELLSVTSGLDIGFVRERLAELRGRGLVLAARGVGYRIAPGSAPR